MKANTNRSLVASFAGSILLLPLLGTALLIGGCAGGTKGDRDNRGDFKVVSISTGTGAIYPYRIRTKDSFGNPTTNVVNIESIDTLKANVSGNNGVLPVATFSTTPLLPDGSTGNQFLHFTFSHKLDVDSILSDLLANQGNSGLTGALNILAYDPQTETSTTVKGRGFVNGYTYYNVSGELLKVKAVEEDGSDIRVLDPRAQGFPSFLGAADLVGRKVFTFVADTDDDLTTIETFPTDKLLRIVVTNAVLDTENDILEQEVSTATTVGPDTNPPQVLGYSTTAPQISPGNNQTGIEPTATILVRFNKPVQPGEVGSFFDPQQFTPPSGGVTLQVTAAAQTYQVTYHADPVSFGDLMNYIITPAYNLPSNSAVDLIVQQTTIHSLTGRLIGTPVTTRFTTGDGPGIVNAPVAPEVIYIGTGGAEPGVAVLDLNGFGQGTGDVNNTRFPLNPNIGVNGVNPPLSPGNSNLNAGSAGTFTLVRDTNLNFRLLRDPVIGAVEDIHIGAPLDLVFNNENINANVTRANQMNEVMGVQSPGNAITQPPTPNPPRLVFPPPNPNRQIFGEEPTTKSSLGPPGALVTAGPPACLASGLNLLVTGNPFANTQSEIGVYPTWFMGVFVGPQPPPSSPPPPVPFCPYTSRQQIGHFLYVLDRDNRQVVVVNSNRFTVLDTISLSDPVSMAVSPNMTRLAVSNFASATVSFIDIDPYSTTFHQIVAETRVERGPTAISWQPDGEDVLVLSTDANFLTIISALDFTVRRSVAGFLNRPIDLIVTERYQATGNTSGVYNAYILNDNGSVAIYESGPDGVNGIGFNDVIGLVTSVAFPRAKSMTYDFQSQYGGVFIGHVDESGLGQVSRLWLYSSPNGPLPLNPSSGGFILPPTFRQKEWKVMQRFGGISADTPVRDYLSGNSIIDLCTDNIMNVGGAYGQGTLFNTAFQQTPYLHSGKHTLKAVGGAATFAVLPRFMFVALSDVGKVDVIEIETGTRLATVDVPGVRVVADYWRQ